MTDRNIGRNSLNDTGTTNSAFELPWMSPASFNQVNNSRAEQTAYSLPAVNITGADAPGRPAGGDPNIINLVGGGTKDLRLADQPQGDEQHDRGARQRLSPQEYAAKLRHLEREGRQQNEPGMDVIKIKKPQHPQRSR